MSVANVVLQGFGNGTAAGSIAGIVLRGFTSSDVIPIPDVSSVLMPMLEEVLSNIYSEVIQ